MVKLKQNHSIGGREKKERKKYQDLGRIRTGGQKARGSLFTRSDSTKERGIQGSPGDGPSSLFTLGAFIYELGYSMETGEETRY